MWQSSKMSANSVLIIFFFTGGIESLDVLYRGYGMEAVAV